MCGILFTLEPHSSRGRSDVDKHLLELISCRGPDSIRTHRVTGPHDQCLTLSASVLHLRGAHIVPQPVVGSKGDVLCWNGEVWSGVDMPPLESDTQALFRLLQDNSQDIPRVFEKIRGPYAFIYYQKLWYGRDILGRRSLLYKSCGQKLILSSVATRAGGPWQEVSTEGIFCHSLDLGTCKIMQWSSQTDQSNILTRSYPAVNTEIPPNEIDTTNRQDKIYLDAVSMLHEKLLAAIKVRVQTVPGLKTTASLSRVAVMYSGGVDCAVLARLLHDVLPETETIDLLNVSFENPRSLTNARKLDPAFNSIYDTPDRITGIQGHQELCETCPSREWRFVKINVPYAEALEAKETVMDLMYPNDSIMDYSIALAFYFCARGQGIYTDSAGDDVDYKTGAKVFFSGLGADEQLGGYSRHIAAYKTGSWPKLLDELQRDLNRIPSRNLGRDDRILSHFAREVRWPFLDEAVVAFLCSLRVDCKMTFDQEGGDKVILRELARSLHIGKAAGEKKRAVQFGSRSARMEVEHDKSERVKGHQKQQ